MDTQTATPTPEASIADMSLAEYRATRENPAAASPAAEPSKEPAHAGDVDRSGESAAEQTGAADDSPEGSEGQEPKKKGGWQRKIEKQARELSELRAQLAEKTKPAATAEEATQNAQPETVGPQFDQAKPKMEDFDSIEAFTDAITDWKLDKQTFEREAAAQQQRQQAETREIVEQWNERKSEFQKQHADYDERMEEVEDISLSPAHQRLLLESEFGPDLAYELAGDRERLEKFAGLHPVAAAKELGKLEATLSAPPPTKETKVSAAPRPIKPVASRSSAHAGLPDLSKISLADYRRARADGRFS